MRAAVRPLVMAAAGAWAVFVAIALWVAADPSPGIDTGLQRAVADAAPGVLRRAPWLRDFSFSVARLGSLPIAIAVVVVAGLGCALWRRTLLPAFILGASFAATAVTVGILKDEYLRPEPYDRAGDLAFSFPSGHAAVAVAAWGGSVLVALLFMGRRPARAELVAGAASVGIALSVGLAMIARSAHWLTDIVAGVALGAAWLCTVSAVVLAGAARLGARSAEADVPVGAAEPVRVDQ